MDCKVTDKCPAYPLAGRVCYAIDHTVCNGETQGDHSQKMDVCKDCPFFKGMVVEKNI